MLVVIFCHSDEALGVSDEFEDYVATSVSSGISTSVYESSARFV